MSPYRSELVPLPSPPVKFPEVQQFIAQMQQEFFGLVPDAMEAVRHALQVEKNPAVAYRLLEATGVAPHQGERLQLPETALSETGMERQARMVGNLLLEARANFGVTLPPAIENALRSEDCESAKAKLVQPCSIKDVSD